MNANIVVFLWAALAAAPVWAQTAAGGPFHEVHLDFEHLTADDGLSQSFVSCIFQDRRGFLWFGTRDGLNRYDGYNFKIYSYEAEDTSSLSANSIQTIFEDKDGNLWFGAWFGGLNKYDRGRDRFVRYHYQPVFPPGPTQNEIFAIHQDRSGSLWLGTADGLKRFDLQTGTFTSFIFKPHEPESWKHNIIYAMLAAENGDLWLGTRTGFLYFNLETETLARVHVDLTHSRFPLPSASLSGAPDDYSIIWSIYRARDGKLLVGSNAGLLRMNPGGLHLDSVRRDGNDEALAREQRSFPPGSELRSRVESAPIELTLLPNEVVNLTGLFTNVISAIGQDEEGGIWIGTASGLFLYGAAQDRISHVALGLEPVDRLVPVGIISIYRDRSGLMWLGTNGHGIYKLNRALQRFGGLGDYPQAASSMRSKSLRAICEARDSTLWIGGYNGLDKFDRKTGRIFHFRSRAGESRGYGGEPVWCIYEDPLREGKILWVGTEGGGLYRFDRLHERFVRFQHAPHDPRSLSDNFVLSIYRDVSGTLWVGTNSGLNRFDDRTEEFTQFDYDPDNPSGLRGRFILSIFEPGRGSPKALGGPAGLWLATNNGISCFDSAAETFTHFVHDPNRHQSLSHNEVLCFKQDRSGRIWIGTSGGLNRLVSTIAKSDHARLPGEAAFVHYSEKDGLPNIVVSGILEDEEGKLWLSTNKGISRFDPETETFRNYDASDGLQSNEFNRAAYYQCRHGELFFGGINGFNMFFPAMLKDNPHLPAVVLTDFKIFNQSVAVGSDKDAPLQQLISETREIRLSHRDQVFSFEFAALEYTASARNQYAYKYGRIQSRLGDGRRPPRSRVHQSRRR